MSERDLDETKLNWIDLAEDPDKPWRDEGYTDAEVMIRGGYYRPLTEKELRQDRKAGVRQGADGVREAWCTVALRRVDPEMGGARSEVKIKYQEPQEVLAKQDTVRVIEKAIIDSSKLRDQFHQVAIMQEEISRSHDKSKQKINHLWNQNSDKIHKFHPVIRAYALLIKEYHTLPEDAAPSVKIRISSKVAEMAMQIQGMVDKKTDALSNLLVRIVSMRMTADDRQKDADSIDNLSDEALIREAKALDVTGDG